MNTISTPVLTDEDKEYLAITSRDALLEFMGKNPRGPTFSPVRIFQYLENAPLEQLPQYINHPGHPQQIVERRLTGKA